MGFQIRNNRLMRYIQEPGVTEISIPEGVTEIHTKAFKKCDSLTRIDIPSSVTKIGTSAFFRCEALEYLIIPEGVEKICADTFGGCTQLKEISLPENLFRIGQNAFDYCKSLEKLVIPDKAEEFGKNMLRGCESLKEVSYRGITFNPQKYDGVRTDRVLDFIRDRDFSMIMSLSAKHDIIFKLFLNFQDKEAEAYIKSNFAKMFPLLIRNGDFESIQEILNLHRFVNKRNIDKFIRYAIDRKQHEIYGILLRYKDQYIGYQSVEDKFKL